MEARIKSDFFREVTKRLEIDGMKFSKNQIQIRSLTNQAVIADKCTVAKHYLVRLKGLIGRTQFEAGEGMLFPRCNDIHMWFMSMPIDVVFIRGKNSANEFEVVSVHSRVKAWKPLPLRNRKASETLELPVGTIERCSIKVGDTICIS